jgi:hypothetical protein
LADSVRKLAKEAFVLDRKVRAAMSDFISPAATHRRESIERALIHHGIDYSPPDGERPKWIINTNAGRLIVNSTEAVCYCQGLADKERQLANRKEADDTMLWDHLEVSHGINKHNRRRLGRSVEETHRMDHQYVANNGDWLNHKHETTPSD